MAKLCGTLRNDMVAEDSAAPVPACLFGDDPNPCDMTTEYAVGEED